MLKRLDSNYLDQMMVLLSEEKELNLFIIGDIERYGFDQSFLAFWGQFEEEKLVGILMRYYDGFTIYTKESIAVDIESVMDVVKSFDVETLAGGKRMLDQFKDVATFGKVRDTYYAKLDSKEKLIDNRAIELVKPIKVADIEALQLLLETQIDEFDNIEDVARKAQGYIDGAKRGYLIKSEEGAVLASAETAAENSQSAMIVAVATHPEHRHKGYATAVMTKLCGALLDENRSLCLFYDNPKAGEIYKRIGFEDIDVWTMWRLKA